MGWGLVLAIGVSMESFAQPNTKCGLSMENFRPFPLTLVDQGLLVAYQHPLRLRRAWPNRCGQNTPKVYILGRLALASSMKPWVWWTDLWGRGLTKHAFLDFKSIMGHQPHTHILLPAYTWDATFHPPQDQNDTAHQGH